MSTNKIRTQAKLRPRGYPMAPAEPGALPQHQLWNNVLQCAMWLSEPCLLPLKNLRKKRQETSCTETANLYTSVQIDVLCETLAHTASQGTIHSLRVLLTVCLPALRYFIAPVGGVTADRVTPNPWILEHLYSSTVFIVGAGW